jgi:hypothetical protein
MTGWRLGFLAILGGSLVSSACSDNSSGRDGNDGAPACAIDGGLVTDAGTITCPAGCYLFAAPGYTPGFGPTMGPFTCVPNEQ